MSHMESHHGQTLTPPEDDWTGVIDPNERRRIQNRNAQRKFREKQRQQREDTQREDENKRLAASTYHIPEPHEVDVAPEPGLPWGSVSLRHVIASGRERQQREWLARQRTGSLGHLAPSRTGGSSRLGLHLVDNYARGSPAWTTWRPRPSISHLPNPFDIKVAGLQDPGVSAAEPDSATVAQWPSHGGLQSQSAIQATGASILREPTFSTPGSLPTTAVDWPQPAAPQSHHAIDSARSVGSQKSGISIAGYVPTTGEKWLVHEAQHPQYGIDTTGPMIPQESADVSDTSSILERSVEWRLRTDQ